MIPLSPATRIYLARGATDLRKSFDGLGDLVSHQFKEDPLSGHLYVFTNRRKNRLKLLYFDGTVTWVCQKVAAIASIVETCRRLDINLRAYLHDVLPKLGDWPANRVAELTPSAWKAAQPKKS